MKRLLTLISILLVVHAGFSQVAVISSPDGYANIREKPDSKSKVIAKVKTNTVILAFNDEIGVSANDAVWSEVVEIKEPMSRLNTANEEYTYGYIHTSQYKLFDQLKNADPKVFKFEYKHKPFSKSGKKIGYIDGSESIETINGEHYFGADCGTPKTEITKETATIGNKIVDIPMSLIWGILHAGNEFEIKTYNNHYYVSQGVGDGGCFTHLVWVFDKNGLVQRFVGWQY